jgi:hypothetical protein
MSLIIIFAVKYYVEQERRIIHLRHFPLSSGYGGDLFVSIVRMFSIGIENSNINF